MPSFAPVGAPVRAVRGLALTLTRSFQLEGVFMTTDTINGTSGKTCSPFTSADELINGLEGTIFCAVFTGADSLAGDEGADFLDGGAGNDALGVRVGRHPLWRAG